RALDDGRNDAQGADQQDRRHQRSSTSPLNSLTLCRGQGSERGDGRERHHSDQIANSHTTGLRGENRGCDHRRHSQHASARRAFGNCQRRGGDATNNERRSPNGPFSVTRTAAPSAANSKRVNAACKAPAATNARSMVRLPNGHRTQPRRRVNDGDKAIKAGFSGASVQPRDRARKPTRATIDSEVELRPGYRRPTRPPAAAATTSKATTT